MSSSVEQIALGLGFTIQELSLNRAGQISARQSWESVRLAAWGAGIIVAVIVAILVLVFLIKPTGILRLVYCFFLIPGFLVVSYIGFVWIRGAIEQRVLVAEGSLSFHGAGRRKRRSDGEHAVPGVLSRPFKNFPQHRTLRPGRVSRWKELPMSPSAQTAENPTKAPTVSAVRVMRALTIIAGVSAWPEKKPTADVSRTPGLHLGRTSR